MTKEEIFRHFEKHEGVISHMYLDKGGPGHVLDDKLRAFAESLRTRFAAFDTFPAAAQLALLDMIFNVGPIGFFKGFPKLRRAADKLDWAGCAAECKRIGISDDRDEGCKNLFLSAVPAPVPLRLTMRRIR